MNPRLFLSRKLSSASKTLATVKVPELRTPHPSQPPILDINEASNVLTKFIQQHEGRVLVMTGAGISTDSGIPDYRGEKGTYVRNPKHRPIMYQEFISSEEFRRRYWARGFIGWSDMVQAVPNPSHYSLTTLLKKGYIKNIITQNVDSLHHFAGTPKDHLIELHGSLYNVECLECRHKEDRRSYQHRLIDCNPIWADYQQQMLSKGEKPKINPDGDVQLDNSISYEEFTVPPCTNCHSSLMKPQVVFFGENIPKSIHEAADKMVQEVDAIVVIGSSLATYSSYRLVKLAHQLEKPIGLLTKGNSRADDIQSWKASVYCLPVLQRVVSNLID